MRTSAAFRTIRRPGLLLLFMLATSMVLIVHRYSRAAFEDHLASSSAIPTTNSRLGHMGEPVTVPAELQQLAADGWQRQGYNQLVSDLISVHRQLPDLRDPWCLKSGTQGNILPSVSVVIVFHDEALSVLLRTVHSVLARTPPALVDEILLVDDWSSLLPLKTFLDDYFLPYAKVRILRTTARIGLIRARILGARQASADYLVFLDAHCECLEGWLEPLLRVVVADSPRHRQTVAVPTIDWLNESTLALQPRRADSGLYGAFDWNLSFQWRPRYDRQQRPRQDENLLEPFVSPVMAGGLFCISKAFFARLGWYDPGLEVYGGENMELSFKVWMCGGAINTVPCSHVGHIQKRSHPYIGGYQSERELTMRNTLRVAEVWMDEYADYLYRLHPDYRGLRASLGPQAAAELEERRQLRSTLACHSFRWYLRNVFPEQDDPSRARAMGWLRSEAQQHPMCLSWLMGDGSSLGLQTCHGLGGHQIWFHGPGHELTRAGHSLVVKKIGPEKHSLTMVLSTVVSPAQQRWQHEPQTGQFIHTESGLCLAPTVNGHHVMVEPCATGPATNQRWTFQIDKI